MAAECARLVRPGGRLVFTVIGRFRPWEVAHYARQRRWARAGVRFARDTVAIGMNGQTIWTRYYTPAEFYAAFASTFELEVQRGLCVFVPPSYMTWLAERHPRWHQRLWALDRRVAGWPAGRASTGWAIISCSSCADTRAERTRPAEGPDCAARRSR